MRVFRLVVRWFFGIVFVLGGVAHIVQGQMSPEGYAAFGETAWLPFLKQLWESWVMPNISWLTLVLAVFEVMVGVGLIAGGVKARWATVAALAFFCFIFVLGYGWPTASGMEDFLKNRVFTLVMVALMVPVLWEGSTPDTE